MNRDVDERQRFAFWIGTSIGALFVTMLLVLTMVGIVFADARSQRAPVSSRVARTMEVLGAGELETPLLRRAPPAHRRVSVRAHPMVVTSLLRDGL